MNEPLDRSHETNTTTTDFYERINAISNRRLTPDNIDRYADSALDDLVGLVDDVIASYAVEQGAEHSGGIDQERAAFEHFGMKANQIELTLDHVADLASEIGALDGYIENNFNNGDVVVMPPGTLKVPLESGNGSFREKKIVPRLKTVLLILKRQLGLDLDDKNQINVVPGKVRPGMIRQTPYNVLDLPTLNRMVDICDEEGNRTFVFDRNKLIALGYSAEKIADCDKEELDHLISEYAAIGTGLVYDSKTFVIRIVQLLDTLAEPVDSPLSDEESIDKLLIPLADKSLVVTVNGMRSKLEEVYDCSITNQTITRVIADLVAIGSIQQNKYRFGKKRVTYGYTAEDFEVVRMQLSKEGLLYPQASDYEISFPNEVAALLGVSVLAVETIAVRIGIEAEDFPYRKFINKTSRACERDTVDAISTYIVNNPLETRIKQGKIDFRFVSNEEIIAQADLLNPGAPMLTTAINTFAEQGVFPNYGTIINRFKSIPEFNKIRGFEQFNQRGLSDRQIFDLADKYFPGAPMKREDITMLSKQGKFVSTGTIDNRFGGINAFNALRGLDVRKPSDLSNDELVVLANRLLPGVRLTVEKANELSKQKEFVSAKTLISRFGSMEKFHESRIRSQTNLHAQGL